MAIQALAVFCGSKGGANPRYVQDAVAVGHLLAAKGIRLIYGAGGKGIMGAVADAVLEKGGQVTGIIPQVLVEWEAQHNGITELIVVEDMHSRKKMLYEKCDAALILPGGYGTLDELFEMLTWNQLSIHNKRIFVLNTAGFYDALYQHVQTMYKEGFLYDPPGERLVFIEKVEELERVI